MLKNSKYLIPNGFTAASMLFGFASMICASKGHFELAAWMITWGVLLDKLDGSFARLLNASSEFGVQYDSFADFVIFGLAPASLFYYLIDPHCHGETALFPSWLSFTGAGFYVVMTSCRLARFNITELPGGDRVFFGLPTTLSGGILSTGYLSYVKYYGSLEVAQLKALPFIIFVFGALMVSPFILPKLKMRKSKMINLFQIVNVSAAYVIAPLQIFPEYLFFLCSFYAVIGFISGALNGVGESPDLSELSEVS